MLIDIGTSKGIRIPSNILKSFNRLTAFDLKVEHERIVLDIVQNPREGWKEKFKTNDNNLLINDSLDKESWNEL